MSQPAENDEIDLTRLIARILRHKTIAIVVAVISFAGAFIYAKFADKFYETSIKFVYQSSTKQTGNLSALAALAGISIGSNSDDGSAYIEDIIKSTDFLSQFTDREWLIADTNKTKDTLMPITLEEFWEIKIDSVAEADREEILKEVIVSRMLKDKYIIYEQDKKTGIITLTTQFEDPKLSHDFNVAAYEELNKTLLEKMQSKAKENRKFIEGRLAEIKRDLKKSEEDLLFFEQQNREWIDPSMKLKESRLLREVTINQELTLQLQKQFELAKIEEARDMPLLDVIESPRRALIHSKPRLKIVLAIGFIGGIFSGLLCALCVDLWNTEGKNFMKQIEKAKNTVYYI
jgi:uncharacterized protein involved in exopolysaccharide biosynthesis